MTRFREKIPRTLAKLITWRFLISAQYFIIGWWASGNPWVGLGAVGAALIVNSTLYWIHERTWNKIDWGKDSA